MRVFAVASLLIALTLPLQATDWGKAMKSAGQLHRKGKLKEAEAGLFKALLLAEAFGESDPRLGYTLDYLGTLSMQLGEAEKAEPMYRRALKVFEASRGADGEESLETAKNLGECLEARGLNAQAEPFYRRVVEGAARRQDDRQRSTDLDNLALCVDAQGRLEEALELYGKALSLREKSFGPDSAEAAEILSNQARVYYMKGDYPKAEMLFSRALANDEKALGQKSAQVAEDCERMAPLYRKTGETAKAVEFEQRAAKIRAALKKGKK